MATVPDRSGNQPIVDPHIPNPADNKLELNYTAPIPVAAPGQAQLYTAATNSLKVIFPDGTVKTVTLA